MVGITHDPETAVRSLLADTGLRVTRQRTALSALLFRDAGRHVTAEGLYDELVRAGAPGSMSCVYRALKDFSEAGLLKRVPVYGSTAYFDTQRDHHHHFYVEDEDRLLDVSENRISVCNVPELPEGYELISVDVLLRIRRKNRATEG